MSGIHVSGGAGLDRRLTVNSLANLLRYGSSLLISFFLTPFVVRTLGDSVYGFWVVLLSFVGYAGVLELGMQPTVVKVVGQHTVTEDRERFEALMAAAFAFFAGVGLIAALAFAFVLPPVIPIIVRDATPVLRSRLLYSILSVDVLLMFLNLFLAGVLYGRQLYPVKNALDIAMSFVNAALLLMFLERGGLILLVSAKLITDLVALAATAIIVRRALPDLRIRLGKASRGAMRELLHFGGRLFVSATTTRVATNAHPMVISARISAAATTFFAIPVRLVDYAREITFSLASGFMPAFSQLSAQRDDTLIRTVYIRYSRYILAATLPIFIIILVYGSNFIGFWIGPEYGTRARIPLALVGSAALIENLQPLYWRLFIGVGRLNTPVVISASTALGSIVMGFLLAPVMGISGPALAILCMGSLAQILFVLDASRYLERPPWSLMIAICGRPLAAGAFLYAFALGVESVLGSDGLLEVAAGAVITLVAYVPLVLGIALDSRERGALRRIAAGALRPSRSPS